MTAPPACPPPAAPDLAALTDQCVQCGLCLPQCPTYAMDRSEPASPRGRIALVRALVRGAASPTPGGDAQLDACLGCRRCEAICPAGVDYGAILAGARAGLRLRRPPGARQRLAEWLTARPHRFVRLLGAYRQTFPLLPRRLRTLPRPTPADGGSRVLGAPDGESAALFLGCIARGYDRGLLSALDRLCRAADVRVDIPDGQTCCGTLHAHAGDRARAAALAAANARAFAGRARVLTTASGCHDAVADALLPKATDDAIAFLAARADRLTFAARPERIALHVPCTQRNVVRSDAALHALLARTPGLEIVTLDAGFGCCGAAGTQMLVDPARAARFRQPLLDQFAASGATALLSANIGCRLHLADGADVPVRHPLEFLAECLA